MNKKEKIAYFIKSLYTKNGMFLFAPTKKSANFYSTCFAIITLDLINLLKSYPPNERDKMIGFIKGCQDGKTGLFKQTFPGSHASLSHDNEYITYQMTNFAILALQALGSNIDGKLNFLKDYKDKNRLHSWLSSLNWENPWLVSNKIMFILDFLIYEEETFNENNKTYIDCVIDWLDKHQDAQNGFWNLGKNSSVSNQMAGAYHFLVYYTYLNKKPNCLEKIIDSVLKLQDIDGLFSYAGGGGACEDLDAVDLLCRATWYTDYKRSEIINCLRKAYPALIKNQNEDGGFCWAKRDFFNSRKLFYSFRPELFALSAQDFFANTKSKIYNQFVAVPYKKLFGKGLTWKYSGLEEMKIDLVKSEIWSTWFRLLTIALIDETFPEISGRNKMFDWKMRRKPGLGFYKK